MIVIKSLIDNKISAVNELYNMINPNCTISSLIADTEAVGLHTQTEIDELKKHIAFCEKVNIVLKNSMDAGAAIERSDWLEIEGVKLQMVSKKYVVYENITVLELGFISF